MTNITYKKNMYDKPVTIKLTTDTFNWVSNESKKYDVPKSVVIRTILESFIKCKTNKN